MKENNSPGHFHLLPCLVYNSMQIKALIADDQPARAKKIMSFFKKKKIRFEAPVDVKKMP